MIILKPTIAFFLLLLLARILGKKQMSQMTFFNYVTGITIGSLAANIITFNDKTIWDEVVGLIWWCLLTALLSIITLKFTKLRVIIDGQPTILIKNGRFQEDALSKSKISIEDLTMMLREQNIFSIKEVDYAILEPNGKLSVLKVQDQLNVIRKDLDIPTSKPKYFPEEIIIDGKIVYNNLTAYGLNVQWLENQLRQQKIKRASDVFYAELQDDGTLYTLLRNKKA
ncbi:DUF421 domain-containing protein [Tissierella sp. Yu-01]|uniref:YetF domain-containing protein n=1 Tax=Tissierella sp. Yu-01 TaxID=3035694 RepID=UPI00240D4E22|nr:DUF421 domain-containing protein [Tissierella sp. Yu-01]WFA09113.1 DUF421 domain-containing protein [Tissierella sp. Yu-01]